MKLTKDNYYLFRSGMALRGYHLEMLFGRANLYELEPNLLTRDEYYYTTGTEALKAQIDHITYDWDKFRTESEAIYNLYKAGHELPVKTLNALPKNKYNESQVAAGLISGILKHNSNGYTISPSALKLKEAINNGK